MNFGNRLKKVRTYLRLSVYDLSREIDVTPGTIYNAEGNKGSPKLELIQKLSEKYPKVNLNWLIAGRDSMLTEKKQKGSMNDQKTLELEKRIEKLEELIKRLLNEIKIE